MPYYRCGMKNGSGGGGSVEYLINSGNLFEGGYIDPSTGALVSYGNTWSYTDFIAVTGNEILNVASPSSSVYNAWYDSSKTFISSFSSPAAGYSKVTVPSNASYVRLSDETAKLQKTQWWRGGSSGSSEPEFTETKICDNSSLNSTLTFTQDYTNYDFIKFVIYNSTSQTYFEIITTPELITNAFTYSSDKINLNEINTNKYVCYTKQSNTSWTRYGKREDDVYEVYGLTCTNKTVTKDVIYNRQAIGSTAVTITSQVSLFGYDYLIIGSCTGGVDETQPCNDIFEMKNNVFGIRGDKRPLITNGYANKIGILSVSEYEISSWSYHFYVQGVKFT